METENKCQMCSKALGEDNFNITFCSQDCFDKWDEIVYEWYVLHEDFCG